MFCCLNIGAMIYYLNSFSYESQRGIVESGILASARARGYL